MTILYRKSARSMSTSSSVTINFNLTFGHRMESFISHKDRIAELMWTWQLENSSEISGKCSAALFVCCCLFPVVLFRVVWCCLVWCEVK